MRLAADLPATSRMEDGRVVSLRFHASGEVRKQREDTVVESPLQIEENIPFSYRPNGNKFVFLPLR